MDEDRARRHGGPSEIVDTSGGGGADIISALPDDVIILVLVRLCCARAAARTGLLSRRWRSLWTRLPDLVFRGVAPSSLLAVLSSLGTGGVSLSLLDVHVRAVQQDKVPSNRVSPRTGLQSSLRRRRTTNDVSSLLRAAARLSPAALCFSHLHHIENRYLDVDLSACFHRATSIDLHVQFLCFPDPRSELPALESLSLSGCSVNLATLVPLCPRLRVLRVAGSFLQADGIVVRSASLQELVLKSNVIGASIGRVHVEAPVLKQFTMLLHTRGDLNVSVSAPLLEVVSWRCYYYGVTAWLCAWGLLAATLETEESSGQQGEDVSRVHVLCLHMFATWPHSYPDAEVGFATEIEKHMITDFSGLEVHLGAPKHVFGAFLFRLLGMHRIRTTTRSLKIVQERSKMKDECTLLVNCSCDEPNDWRTQTISLTNLEKVEIKPFEGQDHEFDFLKLIFRSAPMLRRVTLELSEGFTPNDDWCTKIHNIFMAYPFVECTVDHRPESSIRHLDKFIYSSLNAKLSRG